MDNAKDKIIQTHSKLKPYLSPLNVWALSFGCAVGWGAFVMPGTTFLPIAGPLGTVLGMAIGGIVMLIIGFNYHFMINHYPDAGGTYAYAKRVLGYDHGFLSSWFLILVYIAITWANATALALIFRNLLGDFFQFGFHYSIVGFDIYFGEVMLGLFALWLFGAICIRGGKIAAAVQTIAALILLGGILIGFGVLIQHYGLSVFDLQPNFTPKLSHWSAIISIVVLAPWAFAGFESVSQSTEGFKFSTKKTFAILFLAVTASAMAYTFLTLLAAAVLPPNYATWFDYISDLDNIRGLEHLPTFHAVNELMGQPGLILLAVTVVCGVITGLVGNYIAASRLIYALTRDDLLPSWFGRLNKFKNPQNALLFIMLLSLPIPFLGRTAISWIIDVNTIGATIDYAYTSIITFLLARRVGSKCALCTGLLGFLFSIGFFLYFWTVSAMATESYMILILWSILGFAFFRYIFKRDTHRRLGKSTIVWMSLLFLIFFTSTMWIRQATHDVTQSVLFTISNYYVEEMMEHGVDPNEINREDSEYYFRNQMEYINESLHWLGIGIDE